MSFAEHHPISIIPGTAMEAAPPMPETGTPAWVQLVGSLRIDDPKRHRLLANAMATGLDTVMSRHYEQFAEPPEHPIYVSHDGITVAPDRADRPPTALSAATGALVTRVFDGQRALASGLLRDRERNLKATIFTSTPGGAEWLAATQRLKAVRKQMDGLATRGHLEGNYVHVGTEANAMPGSALTAPTAVLPTYSPDDRVPSRGGNLHPIYQRLQTPGTALTEQTMALPVRASVRNQPLAESTLSASAPEDLSPGDRLHAQLATETDPRARAEIARQLAMVSLLHEMDSGRRPTDPTKIGSGPVEPDDPLLKLCEDVIAGIRAL